MPDSILRQASHAAYSQITQVAILSPTIRSRASDETGVPKLELGNENMVCMSLGTRIRKFLKFFSPLPLGELPRQSGGLGGEGKKNCKTKIILWCTLQSNLLNVFSFVFSLFLANFEKQNNSINKFVLIGGNYGLTDTLFSF